MAKQTVAPVQQRKLKKFNTQLPPELLDQLRDAVNADGAKVQTVVAEAIRAYLAKRRPRAATA
jgi:metal-responsive CopG/Arc/MetJ family transcriptional regulator